MIILDRLDYFQPGVNTYFPQQAEEQRWFEWYHGNYNNLLPPDTLDNGGSLFADADRVDLPLFQVASDFIGNAVLGELPGYSAATNTAENWLKENYSMIDRALRRGVRYWSVADRAVFVATSEGVIRAVDPTYYFRVGNEDDRDRLVGHIIAYKYRERQENERFSHNIYRTPNRMKVTRFFRSEFGDVISDVTHYELTGNVLGRIVKTEPSDITAICVVGSGNGWYSGAADVAGRIILQLTNIDITFNRFRNKAQYLPAGFLQVIRQQMADTLNVNNMGLARDVTPTQVMEFVRNLRLPIVGVDVKSGEESPINPWPVLELNHDFQMLETLTDWFFILSGVPPSSYGIGVGRGESGYAREKAEDASGARVRTVRRDLSDCLPELCAAAGMPTRGSEVSFSWVAPPFQDRSQRQQELLALLAAGVLDVNEVRTALGYQQAEGTEQQERTESSEEE